MADPFEAGARTDGLGRTFICRGTSPDGRWTVNVFGPNDLCNFLYAYARKGDEETCSFGLGNGPASAEQVDFRWDLPNASWGIFIDGECWVIYANRPARR